MHKPVYRHPDTVPILEVVPTVSTVSITCPSCDHTFYVSVGLLTEDLICEGEGCAAWLTVDGEVYGRLEDPAQNRELAEFAAAVVKLAAKALQESGSKPRDPLAVLKRVGLSMASAQRALALSARLSAAGRITDSRAMVIQAEVHLAAAKNICEQ